MQSSISCHLFLYHDLLADGVVETIAEYGFSTIELWAMQPHFPYRDDKRIEEIADFMEKRGVTASSAHLPLYEKVHAPGKPSTLLSPSDPNEARRKRWVQEASLASISAHKLGAKVLTFHTDLDFSTGSEEKEKAFHRSVVEMLEAVPFAGCRLAIENILSGAKYFEGLLRIIEPYHKDKVGLTLDIGHAHIGGDVVEAIKIAAPRLASIHAHDNDGTSDDHLLPGKGTVPWDNVIKTLGETSFDGPLVWEIRDTTAGNDPGLMKKRKILEEIRRYDANFSGP